MKRHKNGRFAGKHTTQMVKELKTQQQTTPNDLSNQKLSKDPAQRVKQLDYQAQRDEQFLNGGTE